MEKEEFEIVKIIPVSIIEDKKQMRIVIPKEIIEKFNIKSERFKFGWTIEKSKSGNVIIIGGRFISKENEKKAK